MPQVHEKWNEIKKEIKKSFVNNNEKEKNDNKFDIINQYINR